MTRISRAVWWLAVVAVALVASSVRAADTELDLEATLARADALFDDAIESAESDPESASADFARAAAAYDLAASQADPPVPGLRRLAADAWALSGDDAAAVLAYRRALEADPWDDAARTGLAGVRMRISPRPPAVSFEDRPRLDRSLVRVALARAAAIVPPAVAIAVAVLAWSLGWGAIAAGPRWRPLGVVLLPVALVGVLPWAAARLSALDPADAVVLTQTEALRGPSPAVYQTAFNEPLPAGLELTITGDVREGYVPVRTVDDRPCWVRVDALARVMEAKSPPDSVRSESGTDP